MLPAIDVIEISTGKHTLSWQYDPWLRQFSTRFTCRATTGENQTSDISTLESTVRVYVQMLENDHRNDEINSHSTSFGESSSPVQLKQGNVDVYGISL